MMLHIRIRNYYLSDQDKIIKIINSVFKYTDFHSDSNLRNQAEELIYYLWADKALKKGRSILIAEVNNRVIGFLIYGLLNINNVFSYSSIILLGVANSFQNRGVGTKLIEYLTNISRKNACSLITVGTDLKNINAIKFYLKNDFKEILRYEIWRTYNISLELKLDSMIKDLYYQPQIKEKYPFNIDSLFVDKRVSEDIKAALLEMKYGENRLYNKNIILGKSAIFIQDKALSDFFGKDVLRYYKYSQNSTIIKNKKNIFMIEGFVNKLDIDRKQEFKKIGLKKIYIGLKLHKYLF